MIIKIFGMEKIKYKCEADKIKAVGFVTRGLIDAFEYAKGKAMDFPFQRPTGLLSARYTYQIQNPFSIAMYNTASGEKGVNYWGFVEYGTGIYATLGAGRTTPWTYFVKAGPWEGFHRTSGQKPKMMLNNAVKDNLARLSEIVRNRVLRGLVYGT